VKRWLEKLNVESRELKWSLSELKRLAPRQAWISAVSSLLSAVSGRITDQGHR